MKLFSVSLIAFGLTSICIANAAEICGTPTYSCQDNSRGDEVCEYFITDSGGQTWHVVGAAAKEKADEQSKNQQSCMDQEHLEKVN